MQTVTGISATRTAHGHRIGRSARRLGATALALTLSGVLAACGGDGSGAGGTSEGLTVSVSEPTDGAEVSVPFTVRVTASVPLGPTGSGRHHVHIWFDDNDADYMVVESETVQISSLPAGEHTMHVSLRNANHSAAGAETSISVVNGGSAGGSSPPSDGGYDY